MNHAERIAERIAEHTRARRILSGLIDRATHAAVHLLQPLYIYIDQQERRDAELAAANERAEKAEAEARREREDKERYCRLWLDVLEAARVKQVPP